MSILVKLVQRKSQATCTHPAAHYPSCQVDTYTASPCPAETHTGRSGETNNEHEKRKRTSIKQIMNYKHCQFQHFQRCFLVFLFPSRQQRTMQLKGMEKSRLIKKSSIKENLLCMRRQHLLKLIHNRPSQNLSALICFARQEILKLTAHYSILFLNCQK